MEASELDRAHDGLANLIEMTPRERGQLAALRPLAALTAPDFAREFCRALLEKQDLALLTREEYNSLLDRVEKWYLDLFEAPAGFKPHRTASWNGKDHIVLGVPVSTVLALVPRVLGWGQNLVAGTPDPEQSLAAFWKSLSFDIASHQVYEEMHLDFLREMVLEEDCV